MTLHLGPGKFTRSVHPVNIVDRGSAATPRSTPSIRSQQNLHEHAPPHPSRYRRVGSLSRRGVGPATPHAHRLPRYLRSPFARSGSLHRRSDRPCGFVHLRRPHALHSRREARARTGRELGRLAGWKGIHLSPSARGKVPRRYALRRFPGGAQLRARARPRDARRTPLAATRSRAPARTRTGKRRASAGWPPPTTARWSSPSTPRSPSSRSCSPCR